MKNLKTLFFFLPFCLLSCVGDDFVIDNVDPVLRITQSVDTLGLGDSFEFKAQYLNNVGLEEVLPKNWSSSDPSVISVEDSGIVTALEMGEATINVTLDANGEVLTAEHRIIVSEETVVAPSERNGALQTTSSYLLTGDFVLSEDNNTLTLSFADNYAASANLPGLYVYLTNNPNTTNGALELGKVSVFSGAHSYTIPSNVSINEFNYLLYFCKPFNVKVGDGDFVD
ncbi:MAG: DM13 domain-containing protein [Bacteroidota bacterium]